MKKIYFVVQGAFGRSDSIAYDAVSEFRLIKDYYPNADVRIFAERFDRKVHDGIPLEPVADLPLGDPEASIVYHYCDGWPDLEKRLVNWRGPLFIRWHNSTPPWFAAKYATQCAQHTILGLSGVIALSRSTDCRFLCNSEFTARQLEILGVGKERMSVVYPASAYLDHQDVPAEWAGLGDKPRILFVSRLAPHKGHKHVLTTAAHLKPLGIDPVVIFPGRSDDFLREYSTELRKLADTLSVEMEMPGEVDHLELERIYRDASAFLCLSEHEGFGMPIFEAMRVGVPTIAWSHTALADLMSDHPLSSAAFSPKRFAAAIAALREPDVADHVIQWQRENVLPRYTRQTVLRQLVTALGGTYPDGAPPSSSCRDGAKDAYVAAQIEKYVRQIPDIDPGPPVPHDIADNFVTVHDIESYRALLDFTLKMPITKPDGVHAGQAGALIEATRFSSPYPPLADGSYLCPLDFTQRHLIFGPYLELRRGAYKVAFQIEMDDPVKNDQDGGIIVDVFSAEHGALCEGYYGVNEISNGAVSLEFSIGRIETAILEFRILARGFSARNMLFKGVSIQRISPLADIIDEAPPYRPEQSSISVMPMSFGDRLKFLAAKIGGVKSSGSFIQADKERDAGNWQEAAALYREGLRADPSNYAMWVQCGHAHKEAGAPADAMACYEKALLLQPGDPDIHLQIGHMLKLQGRLVDAITYYAQASMLAPPAGEFARRELTDFGVLG